MGYVAILGVFVADVTFRADRQPKMGETILGNAFSLGPGGKGSNQAVACARAGAETHFISRLGKDTFADMAGEIWDQAGVNPAVSRHGDMATGAAYIFVEEASGNNAIIICPGVAGTIAPADMDARADLIGGASVFVTQFEQPMEAAMRGLEIAHENKVRTVLNPAPAATLPNGMLGLSDFVTPNESEAEGITGIAVKSIPDAERAADALMAAGAGAAIITLGENGVLYRDGGTSVHVPVFRAGDVVETTGAGDAFNGGFAAALARGMEPVEAVRYGSATAGISVTRPGTAPSMPGQEEIEALLAG